MGKQCEWCGRWSHGEIVTYMTMSGKPLTKVACVICADEMRDLDRRNRARLAREESGVIPATRSEL